MNHVLQHILDAPGVADCRDLHALSACLADDIDIEHSTVQLETADRRRFEERGHA